MPIPLPIPLPLFPVQVLVPKDDGLLGKMVEVEIIETGKHFLKARLLQDGDMYTPSIAEPLIKGQVSGATVIQVRREHRAKSTKYLETPLNSARGGRVLVAAEMSRVAQKLRRTLLGVILRLLILATRGRLQSI